MVSSSKIESLAARFAPYIDELHEFFRSRHVPFGTPHDLQQFPARLHDAAFADEMGSMTRSILYQESETLPRTELMELIALAVGGPRIEDAAEDLHDALKEILSFVMAAARPQRNGSPSEPFAAEQLREAQIADRSSTAEVDSSPLTAHGILVAASTAALPPREREAHVNPAAATFLPPPGLAAFHPTLALPGSPGLRTLTPLSGSAPVEKAQPEEVLAQAYVAAPLLTPTSPSVTTEVPGSLETSPTDGVPLPEPTTPTVPIPAKVPAKVSPELTYDPATVRRAAPGGLRGAYWIPGVFALALVAVPIWWMKHGTPPTHAPVTSAVAPPPPLARAKPSAYGPALHRGRLSSRSAPEASTANYGETSRPSLPSVAASAASTAEPSLRSAAAEPLTTTPVRHVTARHSLPGPAIPIATLTGREGVFLASSGTMAGHLISAPAPGYPKLASFTHVEGAVIVQVVVGRDGRVEATRVLDGPHLLRGAAEHAIKQWRYRPYVVDGKPTDVATIVTVSFRLAH